MPRVLVLVVLGAVLALPASTPAAEPLPTPGCQGIQVFDDAGDSANALAASVKGGPESDLVAGWFDYDPDSGKATANIQVADLDGKIDVPYDAISWEFQFTFGANSRFVRAFQDITGMTKFSWGAPRDITGDPTAPGIGGATTGRLIAGPNGGVQIDLPLAEMGITPGMELEGLALEVRQWLTLPSATPALPVSLVSPAPIYDTAAGDFSFTVAPCPSEPDA